MNPPVRLEWHVARSGNFVTAHPETQEPATVFRNKYGTWGGVYRDLFLSGFFNTPEEACAKMEQWFAGESVRTWRPH